MPGRQRVGDEPGTDRFDLGSQLPERGERSLHVDESPSAGERHRVVDGFGENSLICGRIVAAHVAEDALRVSDGDDAALLHDAPLLAYLHPGRYAEVGETHAFPLPEGFSR